VYAIPEMLEHDEARHSQRPQVSERRESGG
jgi:hypothetical protein